MLTTDQRLDLLQVFGDRELRGMADVMEPDPSQIGLGGAQTALVTVGEFEQRQLRAIREELDRARAERTRPGVRPISTASPSKLSSKNRT